MSKQKLVFIDGIAYTESETKVAKYTVADAVTAAKTILAQRNIRVYCSNAISGRELREKITLLELNELSQSIVDDTNYYAQKS